jgi:hypothetical protein
MPLRVPFRAIQLSPANVLYPYWGPLAHIRAAVDLFTVGPTGVVVRLPAQIDSASDYVGLDPMAAPGLGLRLPFGRQTVLSGAGGHALYLTFPPDGEVSLFVTDYREFVYLPRPLVGFHHPPPGTAGSATYRSVLGATGFLQYFKTCLDPGPTPPVLELDPVAAFPGQHGPLPHSIPLADFLRDLKLHP